MYTSSPELTVTLNILDVKEESRCAQARTEWPRGWFVPQGGGGDWEVIGEAEQRRGRGWDDVTSLLYASTRASKTSE